MEDFMIGVQILAILFVLWMTYFSFLHFKRREFTIIEFAFWQIIWLGLATIVLFPATTRIITRTLGFYRAFDFLTVGGITILFGVTFRNYVLLRRTERKVESLVRQLALQEKK
jgi:hypothetical protein